MKENNWRERFKNANITHMSFNDGSELDGVLFIKRDEALSWFESVSGLVDIVRAFLCFERLRLTSSFGDVFLCVGSRQ